MNIFVLSTGRCGTVTFSKACGYISNYTAGHESQARILGDAHFQYPADHIEIDNRLSWFLGRLDDIYGTDAFYVHLRRDDSATARSYAQRFGSGIIRGYAKGMMMGKHQKSKAMTLCLDYCKTVNSNIACFLKDKPKRLNFQLEDARGDFPKFWEMIGAEGDYEKAVKEWEIAHNKSPNPKGIRQLLKRSPPVL